MPREVAGAGVVARIAICSTYSLVTRQGGEVVAFGVGGENNFAHNFVFGAEKVAVMEVDGRLGWRRIWVRC